MKNWKQIFAVIWTGQFLSILSSTIVNFAVILWISLRTGSAEMLALAAIAAMLPQSLLGSFSGVYVDRLNRKMVMILSDGFIGLCTLLLAILFWLDMAQTWHIFVLLALRSVGSAFHVPAMQASVPLIAPESQLTRIAGIDQIVFSVGNIAGPALAAVCISVWDMEYVLLLDVAGAAVACISLLFVHIPDPVIPEGKTRRNVLSEMKEGLMVILRNRGISWLFLFAVAAMFFIMPVSVMFPLMTLDHFFGNAYQVSLIESLWGAGALLGGAIMGIRTYRINRVVLINLMYMLLGATFLFSGLLPESGFVWFAVLTTIGGVSGSVYSSAFTALVQANIDPSALGRVFSMFYSAGLIPSMIGLIGIGFFAGSLGLILSFIVCGGILIGIGLIGFLPSSSLAIDECERKNSILMDKHFANQVSE